MSDGRTTAEGSSAAQQTLTLDILMEVLNRAANPAALAAHLTSQMREVTGARTVSLLQYPLEGTSLAARVIHVSPERRRSDAVPPLLAWATSGQSRFSEPVAWIAPLAGRPDEATIASLPGGNGLVLPLLVGAEIVGALVLLDLPEMGHRASEVVELLRPLGPVVGLALRNSLLFEQQEATIEERSRQIRETAMRLRALVEAVPDAIYVSDEQGRILEANTAACAMLGYDRRHLESMRMLALSASFAPDSFAAMRDQVRRDGHLQFADEHRRVDGTTLPVEVRLTRIPTATGEPLQLALVRDVTERRRADAERNALQQQLAHAQRLEALGRLAGGIAHDFNNLLTPVLAHADLALNQLPPEHALRDDLEGIRQAAISAREVVRQILAFSRQDQPPKQAVDLRVVVAEAIHLLRALLPSTITIEQRFGERIGMVSVVPGQVHQVIMNLGTNALYAMRDRGGTLTVTLDDVEDASDNLAPWVRLTVADTGRGMSPTVLARIFDPYFTTKPVGDGTGLGLAAVHGIITGWGGTIRAESTEGRGTVFEILLPRTTESPAETPRRPPPARGRGRILFVDDEPAIAKLAKRLLESLGYTVASVTSSLSALELFRQAPDDFDLVITDYTMPGVKGDALAREMLAARAGMPIIICTGHGESFDQRWAAALGVRAVLSKPYTLDAISRAVLAAITGASA